MEVRSICGNACMSALPHAAHLNPSQSISFRANFSLYHHARLCEAPVGVLGDGSGLHLGDGFEPLSDVVADAETRSSAICPSALAHSKHAPAISRKPARGRMRTGVAGAFKETQGHMHTHTHPVHISTLPCAIMLPTSCPTCAAPLPSPMQIESRAPRIEMHPERDTS